MKQVKAVFLDFDGVVIDSIRVLYRGVVAVFEKVGKKPPTFEEFCCLYEAPFEKWFVKQGITTPPEILSGWYHDAAHNGHSPLMPWLEEVLRKIRYLNMICGIISAHFTNKINDIIFNRQIHTLFDFVCGDAHHKVATLGRCCQDHKIEDPQEVLFVGDMLSDIKQGREAGLRTVAYTNGNFSWLFSEKPDHYIHDLREIFNIPGVPSSPLPTILPRRFEERTLQSSS